MLATLLKDSRKALSAAAVACAVLADLRRAVCWAVVAMAMAAAVLGAGVDAAVAQDEAGDGGHFSDDDGSVHEPGLEALAARGVLAGMECGDGLICPTEPLKRREMAVWLVRVLDGADPAPVDE